MTVTSWLCTLATKARRPSSLADAERCTADRDARDGEAVDRADDLDLVVVAIGDQQDAAIGREGEPRRRPPGAVLPAWTERDRVEHAHGVAVPIGDVDSTAGRVAGGPSGPSPADTLRSTVAASASIAVSSALFALVTNTRRRRASTATPAGSAPTATWAIVRPSTRSTTLTVSAPWLVTYARGGISATALPASSTVRTVPSRGGVDATDPPSIARRGA